MVTGIRDINTDPGCGRAADSGMVINSSSNPDDSMTLGGSPGQSDQDGLCGDMALRQLLGYMWWLWPQASSRPLERDNRDCGHRHRMWLRQGHRPRHGPWLYSKTRDLRIGPWLLDCPEQIALPTYVSYCFFFSKAHLFVSILFLYFFNLGF